MLVVAAPCALLWPAAMIIWGPGFSSTTHKHHSVQLVMALGGRTLRIRSGPGDTWNSCGAALVSADAPHELNARGGDILLAFVDPESELGAALLEELSMPICPIDEAKVKMWRDALGDPATLTSARVEPWVRTHLLCGRRMPKIHPKVQRVLTVVRAELATRQRFPLEQLAEVAGLSPSRFMHLFTESVGVPVRPYILWLRLQQACGELMNGASVTQAAHRSGFSDTAHLIRTVRRMMGTTPGELVRRRPATRAAFVADATHGSDSLTEDKLPEDVSQEARIVPMA
jgi:AraC-like DNA-binding protein